MSGDEGGRQSLNTIESITNVFMPLCMRVVYPKARV